MLLTGSFVRHAFVSTRPPTTYFTYTNSYSSPQLFRSINRYVTSASHMKSRVKSSQPTSTLKPPVVEATGPDAKYRPFTSQIAKISGPIELFTAPSHRSYIATSYAITAFCYMYAGWNLYTITATDVQLEILSKSLVGFLCVVTSGMGTIFLLRGTNLISKITAAHSPDGQTLLKICIRRMIPFLKPREIVTAPSKMRLSSHVIVPGRLQTVEVGTIQRQLEAQKRLVQLPFYRAPFAKTSFNLWRIFLNMRRVFTQEQFVYLNLKDSKPTYRLDVTGNYSKPFRTLEKIVVSSLN